MVNKFAQYGRPPFTKILSRTLFENLVSQIDLVYFCEVTSFSGMRKQGLYGEPLCQPKKNIRSKFNHTFNYSLLFLFSCHLQIKAGGLRHLPRSFIGEAHFSYWNDALIIAEGILYIHRAQTKANAYPINLK